MIARLLVLLGVLLLSSGCSTVQPWEKEFIAKPTMAFDPYPLEANFSRHTYRSREASGGGYGVSAGGCGCH